MAYTIDSWLSPNRNQGNYGKVGVTVHHAATTSFRGIGQTFQDPARQASAHYGCEPGHVTNYVPDTDIAWHAGNSYANSSTIGIECVNAGGDADGWPVADETVETLCELMSDLRHDHGWGPYVAGQNLWGHRDWSPTYCPGVLYPQLQAIADRANALYDSGRMFGSNYANGGSVPDGSYGGASGAPEPSEVPDWANVTFDVWLQDGTHMRGRNGDVLGNGESPITYVAAYFPGWIQAQGANNGWYGRMHEYDPNDKVNGCAGGGDPITAIRAYLDTPDPAATGYYKIAYRARTNEGWDWWPWMRDLEDTGGSADDFAGNGHDWIYWLQMQVEKA